MELEDEVSSRAPAFGAWLYSAFHEPLGGRRLSAPQGSIETTLRYIKGKPASDTKQRCHPERSEGSLLR